MAKKMMKKTESSYSQAQLSEEIRKKAQELYEKSGRQQGRDMDNWLTAERLVKSQLCGTM
jgi:hypothetical protein